MKNVQKDALMKLLSGGRFPNNKNRVWTMCQVALKLTTLAVDEAEQGGFTNEQWYIAFEDALNLLSVKDHNRKDSRQSEEFNNSIKTFISEAE